MSDETRSDLPLTSGRKRAACLSPSDLRDRYWHVLSGKDRAAKSGGHNGRERARGKLEAPFGTWRELLADDGRSVS